MYRYKSIARALKSGANLLGRVTISSSWPNQTKIESLKRSGETPLFGDVAVND